MIIKNKIAKAFVAAALLFSLLFCTIGCAADRNRSDAAVLATEKRDGFFVLSSPDDPVFGNSALKRSEITSITFTNDTDRAPASGVWDASDKKNGSIKAWAENGHLYIAAEGKIRPASCEGLFCAYSDVTTIEFGAVFDTSGAESMNSMFFGCSSLTALDLSGFDTSRVANMANMFNVCSSLTSLDLSRFDTSNVTSMLGMFGSCSSLTSLDLSGFDTSNVKFMTSMFKGCSGLTSLDLSSFDTSKTLYMSEMFFNCVSMPAFHIESFSDDALTNISDMFGLGGITQTARKNPDVKVFYNPDTFHPDQIESNDNWWTP